MDLSKTIDELIELYSRNVAYSCHCCSTTDLVPRLGQELAVHSKNCKRDLLLFWLHKIRDTEIVDGSPLDMTSILAGNLLKITVGRSLSRTTLNEHFGSSERGTGDRSIHHDHINELSEKYGNDIKKALIGLGSKMKTEREVAKKNHLHVKHVDSP